MNKYNVVRVSNDYRTPSSERRLRSTGNGSLSFAYPNENISSHPVAITEATAYRIQYPFNVVKALDGSKTATKNQVKEIVRRFG